MRWYREPRYLFGDLHGKTFILLLFQSPHHFSEATVASFLPLEQLQHFPALETSCLLSSFLQCSSASVHSLAPSYTLGLSSDTFPQKVLLRLSYLVFLSSCLFLLASQTVFCVYSLTGLLFDVPK